MLPYLQKAARQVDPALLRLAGPHGHERPAILDNHGSDRRRGAAVPGAAAVGAARPAARTRLPKRRPVGGAEPVGFGGGEGYLLSRCAGHYTRLSTRVSATFASWP